MPFTHPELRRAYQAAYSVAHRAERKAYRATHKAEAKAYNAAYCAAHKAEAKTYSAVYYATHKAQYKASNKAYHTSHVEHRKMYLASYRAAHREESNNASITRRARKASLPATLTCSEWEGIKAAYKYKCAYCGRKFHRLTQDHVIPVSKVGGTIKENIVPACQS